MVVGALFTTLFTLALAYDAAVPFVQPQQLLLWVIGAVVIGISFIVGGAVVWVINRVWNRAKST